MCVYVYAFVLVCMLVSVGTLQVEKMMSKPLGAGVRESCDNLCGC